jgi:predicted RNase H-like HicB family nuclease
MSRTAAVPIRVSVEEGDAGLFYATSPDLRGLLVAAPTVDALESEVPSAIEAIFEAEGTPSVALPSEGAGDFRRIWIALPTSEAVRLVQQGA